MKTFDVHYRSIPNMLGFEVFRCDADNEEHAIEQVKNAYPDYCEILTVKQDKGE